METPQGVSTHAMLSVQDGEYMLITMTGVESGGEDMSEMLSSVEEK